MIHTVYLDDKTVNGRKLLKELHRCEEGIRFENSAGNDAEAEEYLSSEDFWKEADKRIFTVCKKYGVL
ncbi:MAG: hypothetical protein LBH32_06020 [Dysgonamonadaceae bacterium]|jgi:hypothetical protein|nr:hypothetical protein [Dysgonamonadaceae bacterium]